MDGSNVENILDNINGVEVPYSKEPKSRVEKILLKALGDYDGELDPPGSRVEEQLIEWTENGGGGSGGDAVLVTKEISTNGEYKAKDDDADGYSKVSVDIQPTLSNATFTENSTYTVPEGFSGYGTVSVNVQPNLTELDINTAGTYHASDLGYDGYSAVNASFPLAELMVTENGTYEPTLSNYGYSRVIVSCPEPYYGTKYISENGTYYAGNEGYDGFETVEVQLPLSELYVYSLSQTYYASDNGAAGFSTVYVDFADRIRDLYISEPGIYEGDGSVIAYSRVEASFPLAELFVDGDQFISGMTHYFSPHDYGAYGFGQVSVYIPGHSIYEGAVFSSNGTYRASDSGYDGYGEITIDVPQTAANLSDITITENGEYSATAQGYDGFGTVTVSIPSSGGGGTASAGAIVNRTITEYIDTDNLEILQTHTFQECFALTTVSFPACKTIASGAFQDCRALMSANFPACISIYQSAFMKCYALATANFPACISIWSNAFEYCSALTTVSFPVCIIIYEYGFMACLSLATANFPACTEIRNYVFNACRALTTANFPVCKTIGTHAFGDCSALTTVSFPICTSIYSYAFENCSALTTVNFPSCSAISYAAFSKCSALRTASFPVCSNIFPFAFFSCIRLTSLYLLGSSVCKLSSSTAFQTTPIAGYSAYAGGRDASIYVPASLYSDYIVASNWSYFSSRFVSLTDKQIAAL